MKRNRRFYAPDSLLAEYLAANNPVSVAPDAPPKWKKLRQLNGGCELFRILPRRNDEVTDTSGISAR